MAYATVNLKFGCVSPSNMGKNDERKFLPCSRESSQIPALLCSALPNELNCCRYLLLLLLLLKRRSVHFDEAQTERTLNAKPARIIAALARKDGLRRS